MTGPRMTITIDGRRRRVALPPRVVTVAADGQRTEWVLIDGQDRYRAPGQRPGSIDELAKRYEQVRWDDYVRELIGRTRG